jgi:hypothetical protein
MSNDAGSRSISSICAKCGPVSASPESAALIADRGTLSLRQFRTRLGEAGTELAQAQRPAIRDQGGIFGRGAISCDPLGRRRPHRSGELRPDGVCAGSARFGGGRLVESELVRDLRDIALDRRSGEAHRPGALHIDAHCENSTVKL